MKFTTTEVTADQLQKINRYVPQSFPRLTADQVRSVTIRIADNLVNRGQSRWSLDSLQKIALMLPGKPALLDHEQEVENIWGRFYDAQFVQSDEVDDEILDAAGNREFNRTIFDREGYCATYGQAFVAADHEILNDIAFGRVQQNSLGGFRYKNFICPECNISLLNPKCPHTLEGSGYGDESPTVAYFIRDQLIDLGESSLVVVPNLYASQVC